MQKIILDTDIGGDIDDAICLAYLLTEPKCDLLAITTVCGDSDIRASIANAICKTVNKDIPIVAGLDTSLQHLPIYPKPGGSIALKNWPHETYKREDPTKFMYELVKANPNEIIIVAIGNMTNIATLFNTYPDAQDLIKGLYVMNGYFGKEELPDSYYNWNSWADPLASKIVFESKVKNHVVFPLDVTQTLTIEPTVAKEMFKDLLEINSDLINAVLDFGNDWLQSAKTLTLHDPLVAISLFNPDICTYEKGNVEVDTTSRENMGGTKLELNENGNVTIARSVDKKKFYSILEQTLKNSQK